MLVLDPPGRWKDVCRLAFAPDGRTLAAGYFDHGIASWDVRGRAVIDRRKFDTGGALDLALHPAGDVLFAAAGYEGVLELTYPTFRPRPLLAAPSDSARFVAVSPDGRRLVYNRFDLAGPPEQPARYLLVGRVADRGGPRTEWELHDPDWVVLGIVLLPDGERFVSVDGHYHSAAPPRLAVRSAATGRVVRSVPSPTRELKQLAASPDGRTVALRAGRSVLFWDPADLDPPPRAVTNDTRAHFTAVAFHPSGRYLAATSNDATVKLYDTASWAVARTFTWKIGKLRSVAFSADGTLAAAGSDTGAIVVWDVDE